MESNSYKRHAGNRESKGKRSTIKKVVVSYIYQDRRQGQTFEEWDKVEGRLLKWLNIILRLNNLTVEQALRERVIVKYNSIDTDVHNMPIKSKWEYPQLLSTKSVIWCKIVVMQLVRVIGFMEENIFYLVFLDENHEFYPTEPRNT